MMQTKFQIAAMLSAAAAFFWFIFLFAFRHRKKALSVRPGQPRPDEWLFAGWSENVYDSLFKENPAVIARRVGVNVEAYTHNCEILKEPQRLKDIIVKKLMGFLLIALCGFAGIALKNILIIFFGVLAAIPLIFFGMQKIESAVKLKKFRMVEELPRFIDLLQTALLINLPVEDAIMVTAKNLKETTLAQEFLSAVAEAQMGVHDWQAALERLARKYEIDPLSDFVLDLVTSYNKGVPIADAVARKSRDIKQSNLLSMKARASKLTSTILLPVLGFKVMPLLALLCIPIIQQITSGL